MAFSKEDRKLWLGVGIGAGGAIAAPFLAPVVAAIARPLLKAAIAQTLVAAEQGREGLVRVAEVLSDVVAEIRAEAEERMVAAKAGASVAVGGTATEAVRSGAEGADENARKARGEPN